MLNGKLLFIIFDPLKKAGDAAMSQQSQMVKADVLKTGHGEGWEHREVQHRVLRGGRVAFSDASRTEMLWKFHLMVYFALSVV